MYLPSHFAQTDREVLHRLMQEHSLSTLVTMTASGLDANHIPLLLTPGEGEYGVLRGHVARANPIWKEYQSATDVMAIFQGADAYISPSWYPSKHEHGKAVPTWNYAVVHASGPLRIIDDAVWLREQLTLLTSRHESALPQPWSIEDAPADYIDKMLSAVVGIEITITKLVGKWKVSQNQPASNRVGVIEGLHARGQADTDAMALLVAQKTD